MGGLERAFSLFARALDLLREYDLALDFACSGESLLGGGAFLDDLRVGSWHRMTS